VSFSVVVRRSVAAAERKTGRATRGPASGLNFGMLRRPGETGRGQVIASSNAAAMETKPHPVQAVE
jgi:hypothetical protein